MSVEGNRFEPAAVQNLLALFVFEDWSRVMANTGALHKDMKAALRTAVRQAGQWANREGARGLAKAVNAPLNVLRKGLRLKFQYQSVRGFATARLWYGLNAISLKYLGARQIKRGVTARGTTYKGGFIAPALKDHAFQRVGSKRLPIKQLEMKVADKGTAFLEKFEKQVAMKFVEFFFAHIDKATGRAEGESASLAGTMNLTRA
jgi:hypothetical protein